MSILIDGRIVEVVADLRVGDRLPAPSEPCGYIEVVSIEDAPSAAPNWPLRIIQWVHNIPENGAPSRWMKHFEVHGDGSGGWLLVSPPRVPANPGVGRGPS